MTAQSRDADNLMAGLPKGFYDAVGNLAKQQLTVLEDFYSTGMCYGFEPAFLSEVGLEDTFLSFGTAAHGRGYLFEDEGKERLMLSADSLASCIRAYLSNSNTSNIHRMMSKVPVFRHRHKKYRRWSHLIYSIFQEPDGVMAVLSLLEVANSFLKKYYDKLVFAISLYGLFEGYCEHLSCTHEQMYEALHSKYDLGKCADNEIFAFIEQIECFGKNRSSWHQSLESIRNEFPKLSNIVDRYSAFFVGLEHMGIDFYIDWEHYHAIEYSSGICFLVKNTAGATIADGGSYDYLVHSLNKKIDYCYSFACSLEGIQQKASIRKNTRVLYLIKMDCTVSFFLDVCTYLRDNGYIIHELSTMNKLREILKRLPDHSKYICIGQKEESSRELIVDNRIIKV